jgi:hypothetical protein
MHRTLAVLLLLPMALVTAFEPLAELSVRLSEDLPVKSCHQVLNQLQVNIKIVVNHV